MTDRWWEDTPSSRRVPQEGQRLPGEVLSAMLTLTRTEAIVVLYRYHRGWSNAQVAERLDVSQSCVRTHLSAALRKLREALG